MTTATPRPRSCPAVRSSWTTPTPTLTRTRALAPKSPAAVRFASSWPRDSHWPSAGLGGYCSNDSHDLLIIFLFRFVFMIAVLGGTLWHLPKFLQGIVIEFTPSIILLYPPSSHSWSFSWSHLTSQQPYGISTIIIPIIQMRKPRLGRLNHLPKITQLTNDSVWFRNTALHDSKASPVNY
jgi:hypothetical protein